MKTEAGAPDPYQVVEDAEGIYEGYDVLRGPDDFECILTEPERRRWNRDGAAVVARLNQQHAEIEKLREQCSRLLLEQRRMGMASALYRMSRAEAEQSMADALKKEFGVRIIADKVEDIGE